MKLAIPLLLVAVFLCVFLHHWKQENAPPAASNGSPAAKRPSLMAARYAQQAEQQRRRRADMDEVMAKNAQAMTPQLKKLMINRLMEVRSPKYRQLFDSLHVDATTQQDLLDAIREREERLYDLHKKQRAEGMRGIKEFGEDYKIERLLTDKLFGLMVGDEKAAEIIKLEAEMLGAARTAVANLMD